MPLLKLIDWFSKIFNCAWTESFEIINNSLKKLLGEMFSQLRRSFKVRKKVLNDFKSKVFTMKKHKEGKRRL